MGRQLAGVAGLGAEDGWDSLTREALGVAMRVSWA